MRLRELVLEGHRLLEAAPIAWKDPAFIEKMKKAGILPSSGQMDAYHQAKAFGVNLGRDAPKFLKFLASKMTDADYAYAIKKGWMEEPAFPELANKAYKKAPRN